MSTVQLDGDFKRVQATVNHKLQGMKLRRLSVKRDWVIDR